MPPDYPHRTGIRTGQDMNNATNQSEAVLFLGLLSRRLNKPIFNIRFIAGDEIFHPAVAGLISMTIINIFKGVGTYDGKRKVILVLFPSKAGQISLRYKGE